MPFLAENVIVYGRYLEALTCLETLVQLPVPPHRLVLVLPPGDGTGNRARLSHDPEVRLCGHWTDGTASYLCVVGSAYSCDGELISGDNDPNLV